MVSKLSLATFLSCLFAIFFCTQSAAAKTIELKLKDGSSISGKLLTEDAKSYQLELGASQITVLKADVDTLATSSSTAAIEQPQVQKTGAGLSVAAPPSERPLIRGKNMKGVGIAMFLAGGLASAGSAFMAFEEGDRGYVVPLGVGASVGIAGLVLAIVGRKQETESEAKQKEWDAKYGTEPAITQLSAFPIISDSVGGFGLQGRF